MALEPKKGNELTAMDELSATTLVILSDATTGKYFKYPFATFLNFFNKEIIPFADQQSIEIEMTAERKLKFGNALVITAELLSEGDIYRQVTVDIKVDSITEPTLYTILLAGNNTGRLIIT